MHPVSPTDVLLLVFFIDLFKVSKITIFTCSKLVKNYFDLFNVSKITIKFLTCSKLVK